MVQKQSVFSRSLYNDTKLGAYYTDLSHCKRIGKLFQFQEETCVLEPSSGDGSALEAFLDGSIKKTESVYTYGVEMNEEAAQRATERLNYVLKADFLHGTYITNKAFSFCFSNPPYGTCGDSGKERLEQKFIERIFSLMKPGGYIVLILNRSTLENETVLNSLLSRFICEKIYKFDDEEYEKYHQYCFIGIRKDSIGRFRSEIRRFSEILKNLEEKIPDDPEIVFIVPGSLDKKIEVFSAKEFDPSRFKNHLKKSPLLKFSEDYCRVKQYHSIKVSKPPLPLKKDLLYLCAIAGGGQGICGSEENGDLHLQRGVAKRIEFSDYVETEDGDSVVEVVRSSTKISMNIIDNSGVISELS